MMFGFLLGADLLASALYENAGYVLLGSLIVGSQYYDDTGDIFPYEKTGAGGNSVSTL